MNEWREREKEDGERKKKGCKEGREKVGRNFPFHPNLNLKFPRERKNKERERKKQKKERKKEKEPHSPKRNEPSKINTKIVHSAM